MGDFLGFLDLSCWHFSVSTLDDIRAARAQAFLPGSIRMVLDSVGESLPRLFSTALGLHGGRDFWIQWSASG